MVIDLRKIKMYVKEILWKTESNLTMTAKTWIYVCVWQQ